MLRFRWRFHVCYLALERISLLSLSECFLYRVDLIDT